MTPWQWTLIALLVLVPYIIGSGRGYKRGVKDTMKTIRLSQAANERAEFRHIPKERGARVRPDDPVFPCKYCHRVHADSRTACPEMVEANKVVAKPMNGQGYVLGDGTKLEELKVGDTVIVTKDFYRDYGSGIVADRKKGDTDTIKDIYRQCSWPLIFTKWSRTEEDFYGHIALHVRA